AALDIAVGGIHPQRSDLFQADLAGYRGHIDVPKASGRLDIGRGSFHLGVRPFRQGDPYHDRAGGAVRPGLRHLDEDPAVRVVDLGAFGEVDIDVAVRVLGLDVDRGVGAGGGFEHDVAGTVADGELN